MKGNSDMDKEEIKNIGIKLLLSIPAILIGIFGAIIYILKPLITLWSDKKEAPPVVLDTTPPEKHEFH